MEGDKDCSRIVVDELAKLKQLSEMETVQFCLSDFLYVIDIKLYADYGALAQYFETV